MAAFMLPEMKVKDGILDDERYNYIFTVEDVNRLVLEGMPFRDAYRTVGMAVQNGTYQPNRTVNHTHLGSIGNLATDAIDAKMASLMAKFG